MQRLFALLGLVLSTFAVFGQSLSQQQVQIAVNQAMAAITANNRLLSRTATATVTGVVITNPNLAEADLRFSNATYDCGSAMGPANAGAPWYMKKWGVGKAILKHYEGGSWTLTDIQTDEIMCSNAFTIHVAIAGGAPASGASGLQATASPSPGAAQNAVNGALAAIKARDRLLSRTAAATLAGVMGTGANMAEADLRFINATYDCGTGMGPANAGAPWLMKKWGIGKAIFRRYEGSGWHLTEIDTDELMCSTKFTLDVPATEGGSGSQTTSTTPNPTPPAPGYTPPPDLAEREAAQLKKMPQRESIKSQVDQFLADLKQKGVLSQRAETVLGDATPIPQGLDGDFEIASAALVLMMKNATYECGSADSGAKSKSKRPSTLYVIDAKVGRQPKQPWFLTKIQIDGKDCSPVWEVHIPLSGGPPQ